MNFVFILLMAAVIFGICHVVDKFFTRLFRSKAQHRSGLAVRVNKMYGVMGLCLIILGIMAILVGLDSLLLLVGGIIVLAMGSAMAAYYLTRGIFYDTESFLISGFGSRERTYRYQDIAEQRLYLIQGGSVMVELHMTDGTAVSLTSNMDGVYPFLDTAFSGWCQQTGRDPESCTFHDPSNHWWFPHEEA